jgi:hypothetical protein
MTLDLAMRAPMPKVTSEHSSPHYDLRWPGLKVVRGRQRRGVSGEALQQTAVEIVAGGQGLMKERGFA